MAISTRDVDAVHERAVARHVPCTPISVLPTWNETNSIRYFFCEVGGITFEVLQVGPAVIE